MAEMSQAQKAYLRKRSHDRRMISIWRILLFLLFLGAWREVRGLDGSIPLSFPVPVRCGTPLFPCAAAIPCSLTSA